MFEDQSDHLKSGGTGPEDSTVQRPQCLAAKCSSVRLSFPKLFGERLRGYSALVII